MIGSRRKRYRAAVEAARAGQNPNTAVTDNYSVLDRIAIALTGKVGTMKFTLFLGVFTVGWIFYNLFAPTFGWPVFDQLPALVVYLLGATIFSTILMPLLMVGQNMQARQQEAKAEQDYENNRRALEILIALYDDMREEERLDSRPEM